MNTNLELISLDDDELLGVVGGCGHPCSPRLPPAAVQPAPPCGAAAVPLSTSASTSVSASGRIRRIA